ncbi:MAG: hypothetical protein GXY55_12450 [Phycisphaerae bacterium]|nr:hypothetical protein [Phycisphaerae bacterium]
MAEKLIRVMMTMVVSTVLVVGVAALTGCEPKRERHVHQETIQKDVVVDEGPVVE